VRIIFERVIRSGRKIE